MSSNIQIECFLCIDEHGNYQVLGSSKKDKEHTMKALVRDGITSDVFNWTLQTFKVNVQLPIPKDPLEIID